MNNAWIFAGEFAAGTQAYRFSEEDWSVLQEAALLPDDLMARTDCIHHEGGYVYLTGDAISLLQGYINDPEDGYFDDQVPEFGAFTASGQFSTGV